MYRDHGSASAGQKLRWPRRLSEIGKDARQSWHRFHWRSEDTLAVLITAIGVLVMFMVLLRP